MRKTALLPTTHPALGKKIGELLSTNSLAQLLAEILKVYVCLCVALAVAENGWKVAAAVTLPVFPTSVSRCLSTQTLYLLTLLDCQLGLSTMSSSVVLPSPPYSICRSSAAVPADHIP